MPKEHPADLVAMKNPKLRVVATGKAATDREGDNMVAHTEGDVTRYDSQRGLLAQHSVAILLRHCFEWLHCSSIATPGCAKNPRCES